VQTKCQSYKLIVAQTEMLTLQPMGFCATLLSLKQSVAIKLNRKHFRCWLSYSDGSYCDNDGRGDYNGEENKHGLVVLLVGGNDGKR